MPPGFKGYTNSEPQMSSRKAEREIAIINEGCIVPSLDVAALVAACESYDEGPGTVLGCGGQGTEEAQKMLLQFLGVTISWDTISVLADAAGYYDK